MVNRKSLQETVVEPVAIQENGCRHHWLIDRPSGPVSKGSCRVCGEIREFRNYFEGSYWGDDDMASVALPIKEAIPVGAGVE